MQTQWIVLANRTGAKIFEMTASRKPKLVREIANPRGRVESARDINSDRAGRNASFGARGLNTALQKRENPTEHISNLFASKLSGEIDKARHLHNFDQVSIVAEPHLLGKIKRALSGATRKTLRATIKKDINQLGNRRISEILLNQMELKPTIQDTDDIPPGKRERWAKELIETKRGKLGRSIEGGALTKRNKGSGKTKRGQRAAARVQRS
jgi:protein required for attachment to host cells